MIDELVKIDQLDEVTLHQLGMASELIQKCVSLVFTLCSFVDY